MNMIRPSKVQRDGLFGALVFVFVLAFIRGYPGATTTGGKIAVALFAGVVTGLLILGWVRVIRRPSHLEITPQAVTLVEPGGHRTTLSRESGDEILVTATGGGRYRKPALTIAGSGILLPLSFYSISEIRRQCLASGWRFRKPGWRRSRG
ncbi:MAG TPA: hypothetical protein VFW16_00055 [Streptosporangiaceae bacterium]|nr:hypothetical protein [Streptosporangiaceae bacterium]